MNKLYGERMKYNDIIFGMCICVIMFLPIIICIKVLPSAIDRVLELYIFASIISIVYTMAYISRALKLEEAKEKEKDKSNNKGKK